MAVEVLGNGLKFDHYSAEEKSEIIRALTVVLDDPSPKVRKTLASTLIDIDDVPYHLVQSLVQDQIDVAMPLLARYPGLRDADLVDLVGQGSPVVCEIIATRNELPAAVSGAIAEVGTRESCATLLENQTARIAQMSLARLAERFALDAHIRASMLAREDLPAQARHNLLSHLSDALGNLVVAKLWLPAERARATMLDACEKATIEFSGGCEDNEQRALVAHLASRRKLNPGIMIRALVIGNIAFVAEALALLAHVPVKRCYRLMGDRRGAGLKALMTKAGLPATIQTGFSLAIGCVLESQSEGLDFSETRDRRRLVERILTRYQDYANDDLDYLFTLLTRLATEAAREDARQDFGAARFNSVAA